jgi:HK97 family phage major capsid protein
MNTQELLTQLQVKLGKIDEQEAAIKQLEQGQRALLGDVDKKIAAVRSIVYDPNGHYRGQFADEEQARTFLLTVMAKTAPVDELRTQARQKLQSDHRSFADRQKDVLGEQALLPHEHFARVHRLVEDSSVWAGHAFMMPMQGDTGSFTRRVSGFRARISKVRQKLSKQDMRVAPVDLTAMDFDILTSYPKSIADDSIVPLAELMLSEMVLGFSLALEEDGLIGDGSEDYDNAMGIVPLLKEINGVDNGGGLILATGAAGAGWSGIVKDDILKMIGQARYTRPGKGVFIGSNEFFWQVLAPIITDAGGVTRAEMETGFTLNAFGVPYEVSHVMPRTAGNSQIPLLYGDVYQSSTLGNRQRLTVDVSRDVYFESKEVAILGTARYAINNHSLGDATTAGPVVGLITPAAG